ncbi:MAG TPA: hypothetical protein VKQ71_12100 [Acidimicrobiales bacterium]|nr:hypothetical protein [Acidimicrobiales bacterium]
MVAVVSLGYTIRRGKIGDLQRQIEALRDELQDCARANVRLDKRNLLLMERLMRLEDEHKDRK